MYKHFKYHRSSLNITIPTVRSNVLFSKFIDVLNLNYLYLNSNYSIYVKLNIYKFSCSCTIELPPFEFKLQYLC